ncbi:hypothetical protein GCM10010512_12540 [Streptomyces thermoviolaceus subsp. thermoviolaceus]|nr:hypothetical protein GCM10010499_13620 [Streptomyces thermoviolaceus subsp. apingens]GHA82422.1 hypothetical protein GCM10010512_12540 [Streptomyces thermoviolaceus subsp. thermoviolaceus]
MARERGEKSEDAIRGYADRGERAPDTLGEGRPPRRAQPRPPVPQRTGGAGRRPQRRAHTADAAARLEDAGGRDRQPATRPLVPGRPLVRITQSMTGRLHRSSHAHARHTG